MGRAAVTRVIVRTTKLALEADPWSQYDAPGVYGLGFNSSKLARSPDKVLEIDRLVHVVFTILIDRKTGQATSQIALDSR